MDQIYERTPSGGPHLNPFDKNPSGSEWDAKHMCWLGVILRDALPMEHVLNTSDNWLPSDNGSFVREAGRRLNWPLANIRQGGRQLRCANIFYNALSEYLLGTVPRGEGNYSRSFPVAPASPPESNARTPQHGSFRSSPPLPRTPARPSPPRSVGFTPHSRHTPGPGPRTPRGSNHLESMSINSQLPRIGRDASVVSASPRPRGSSDTEFDPSYTSPPPSQRDEDEEEERKAENKRRECQVVAVVKAFREVMSSIVNSCNNEFANTLQN